MRLTENRRKKYKEEIIKLLMLDNKMPLFTKNIADTLCRDDEFIKVLLGELKKEGKVIMIDKSEKCKKYLRKRKWGIKK